MLTATVTERSGPDRRTVLAATAATAVVLTAGDELGEVTRPMQSFAASNVDDAAVEQLNVSVDLIGCRYEGSDARPSTRPRFASAATRPS